MNSILNILQPALPSGRPLAAILAASHGDAPRGKTIGMLACELSLTPDTQKPDADAKSMFARRVYEL